MSIALGTGICDHADNSGASPGDAPASEAQISKPGSRPFVAVGTKDGVLVDRHIGEVWAFQIWEPTKNGYMHLDDRLVRVCDIGRKRWLALADALRDCRAVLVSGAGVLPARILAENGITVLEMNSFVPAGLDAVYHGKKAALLPGRRRKCSRGGNCFGVGEGCRKD
jgi:nitrogen fixation protein NifB